MLRVSSCALLASLAACVSRGPITRAPSPTESAGADSVRPRFYARRDYGSEAQFNPLSEIVNDGLDQLRVDWSDRRVLQWPWGRAAGNVARSLRHAERAYRGYGWGRALRNEILPLTTRGSGGGQWFPNYQFHLIGSGMVSARMTEWYEAHGAPHPGLFSFGTMTAAHFLNEMTEDGGRDRPNSVDAITDLYLFDVAGFLLFRSDRVQRLFSATLPLTNWPLQPSWRLSTRTVENVGQAYALRVPLPGTTRWRGLYVFGIATFFGLSRSLDDGYAVSVAGGVDVVRVRVVDTATQRRTVDLQPNGGIFVDREGSLLFSLLARDGPEIIATANLYPGVLPKARALGVWAQLLRSREARFGIATPVGVGVGW